jgi:Na+-driven multidrug efflux pump
MIVIAGLVLGAATGAITAKRRGGSTADILQYAAGYGLAFTIVASLLTFGLSRLAG